MKEKIKSATSMGKEPQRLRQDIFHNPTLTKRAGHGHFGTFGGSNGIKEISPRPQAFLDIFFIMIYISPRWLDAEIYTKRLARPPETKTKFL